MLKQVVYRYWLQLPLRCIPVLATVTTALYTGTGYSYHCAVKRFSFFGGVNNCPTRCHYIQFIIFL